MCFLICFQLFFNCFQRFSVLKTFVHFVHGTVLLLQTLVQAPVVLLALQKRESFRKLFHVIETKWKKKEKRKRKKKNQRKRKKAVHISSPRVPRPFNSPPAAAATSGAPRRPPNASPRSASRSPARPWRRSPPASVAPHEALGNTFKPFTTASNINKYIHTNIM